MTKKIFRPEDRLKITQMIRSATYRYAKQQDPSAVRLFENKANAERKR